MTENIQNIAIFAHVDAGKTSITEQFLFLAGSIRTLGTVAAGTTQTDTLAIEKERGITVTASVLSFEYQNTKINLIDTPGHIDFSSEVQRAFWAIDAAIVVVSAVEGLQAQTENVINQLLEAKKPFLVFINKVDRMGADVVAVQEELEDLSMLPFTMQMLKKEGTTDVEILAKWSPETFTNDEEQLEMLLAFDDNLLITYFEGISPDFNELNAVLKSKILEQEITPVFLGSAKYSLGVKELLDAVIQYLPKPKNKQELAGIIFKSLHQNDGKWLAVRLFGGTLKSREEVYNASRQNTVKINTIKSISLGKQRVLQEAIAGDVVLIKGLNEAKPGDFIGRLPKNLPKDILSKPLLSVQLALENTADTNKLVEALTVLNDEDPALDFEYIKDENEFHIKIQGLIHQEILTHTLTLRFGLSVTFLKPTIIYKETPTQEAVGYVRYWMPKPCWAIMRFKIEPLPRGSGVEYSSLVGVNDIKKQYQNDVAKMIPIALKQGILGWEVTDVAITLIEGEDHVMHTKSNDFSIATPMGVMDGFTKANMTLLEPVLRFKIKTASDFVGKITSELILRRAKLQNSETKGVQTVLIGEIPAATALDFPIKLSAMTSGKAKLNMQFLNYQKCAIVLGETRAFKGVSPLDTAKYILKARKALV